MGNKKELTVIRAGIRTVMGNMETLLTENGFGHDIQDCYLRDMYFDLLHMVNKLTVRIEAQEPAEIELVDNVPGMVVEPPDIPERDLSGFDI